jgi:DNA-binding CsgD family transcriptional regulator
VRTVRRNASDQTVLVELTETEWEAIGYHAQWRVALERALAAVSEANLEASLHRVAEALPLAVGVEVVAIRLLAEDADALYLVAQEGFAPQTVRDLALDPVPLARLRSMFSLGHHHSHAQMLGLRYLSGEWMRDDSGAIGSITIGCRTERRPTAAEPDVLREAAVSLGASLAGVERSSKRLRNYSLMLARATTDEPAEVPDDLLTALRPREATVLELYTRGRSVDEIASMLVISPHTVRTHIKLAFRRLGVHSREEAAELVRSSDIAALV